MSGVDRGKRCGGSFLRILLVVLWLFVYVPVEQNICRSEEVIGCLIEPDASTMQELKKAYIEFEQAVEHFLKVNKEAIGNQSELGNVQTALLRIKDIESQGLASRERYWVLLKKSEDPNEVKEIFTDCRTPFGVKVEADALKDPVWAAALPYGAEKTDT